MVRLSTAWLTRGNAQINTPQPQVILSVSANVHSIEVLSEVSYNPPIHVNPVINCNQHTYQHYQ